MKKIIPIFLLIIISINHLNIIDAVLDFIVTNKSEISVTKNFSTDEQSDNEKDKKGKEKIEEQDKYYVRHNYAIAGQFQLSARDKFVCFNATLNKHPYNEDDIQPPNAV